jgi:putative flippase GtrA
MAHHVDRYPRLGLPVVISESWYYPTATLMSLIANVILFSILTQILGVFYIFAQIIVIGILFVLNFIVNRTFTFGEPIQAR